jgi:protein TonB
VQVKRNGQLLFMFVAGSLALHVAVLALVPHIERDRPSVVAQRLDVALVRVEPPQPLPAASPEARRIPATPTRKAETPPRTRETAPTLHIPDQRSPASADPHSSAEPVPGVAERASEPRTPRNATGLRAAASTSRVDVPVSAAASFTAEYLHNPAPRYPLIARRNGEQGTVTLRVLVTREGVPSEVRVEKSSGSSHLDGAALDAVRSWRFVPARRNGEVVEAWVLVPVVFKLEGVS